MATQPRLKLRELRKILRSYGVHEDARRGKGSHTYFYRQLPEGEFGYAMPTKPDAKAVYVKGLRKRLRLMPENGVSDQDFFSRR